MAVTTESATAELAERMNAARQAAGLSYKRLERAMFPYLRSHTPTDEKLRRYCLGEVEAMEPVIVLAVALICDVDPYVLAPEMREEFHGLRALVERASPWITAGQPKGKAA